MLPQKNKDSLVSHPIHQLFHFVEIKVKTLIDVQLKQLKNISLMYSIFGSSYLLFLTHVFSQMEIKQSVYSRNIFFVHLIIYCFVHIFFQSTAMNQSAYSRNSISVPGMPVNDVVIHLFSDKANIIHVGSCIHFRAQAITLFCEEEYIFLNSGKQWNLSISRIFSIFFLPLERPTTWLKGRFLSGHSLCKVKDDGIFLRIARKALSELDLHEKSFHLLRKRQKCARWRMIFCFRRLWDG